MRRDFVLPALLLAAAAGGCSSSNDTPGADAAPPDAPAGKACTTTLSHGADDQTAFQTALIGAHSGDLICIAAGTFTFTDELSLSVSGVTLRGASTTTILDFSTQANGGNALKVTGGDFIVEHLTVKDPKGDGIRTEGVTNVAFRDIRVYWSAGPQAGNGAYGVYPVSTTNVLIDGIEVSGAADAAIYVGQSHNILVKNSTAFDSVAGIEIENSSDAEVVNNTSHDNVAGILVFNLPQLPTKTGARAKVHGNMIMNNNRTNFAASGSVVSNVPKGTGVLILAADSTEVHNNTISGNNSVASLVVSCDALAVVAPGVLACDDPGYDHNPDGVYFHDNTYTNNGTAPDTLYTDPPLSLVAPVPTYFFANLPPVTPTTDNKLCITETTGVTFLNFLDANDNLAMHNCTHATLPAITPTWGVSP
jgi:parallel beta-helix repeat protein